MSPAIIRLDSARPDFESELQTLLKNLGDDDASLVDEVRAILRAVRDEGDDALIRYSAQFDKLKVGGVDELKVPLERAEQALRSLPETQLEALRQAARRIRDYHDEQRRRLDDDWRREDAGLALGQRRLPMRRVGLYVPGGGGNYASTALMSGIPAKVAGVEELIMVSPAADGEIDDGTLAAAALIGVDKIFKLGGAHAIAALAFGSQNVPRADIVVGPGNRYVAEAKRQVYGRVGIDIPAGPSEALIIADAGADAELAALDLLAQAEHDAEASAVALSPDEKFLDEVQRQMQHHLESLSRRDIIEAALTSRGALIKVQNLHEAVNISERIAPEHLHLMLEDAEALLPKIRAAGAVFLGRDVGIVLGDYCAGPSHVLPTAGAARFASPLGVENFMRRSSIIGGRADNALLEVAATLADMEGFSAHARSARARL